jgi:hypothetical protein
VHAHRAEQKEAHKLLSAVLTQNAAEAAETLGHIDYKAYADRFVDWCAETGQTDAAISAADALCRTLSERSIHGRGIAQSVLEDATARRDALTHGQDTKEELRNSMKADLERRKKDMAGRRTSSAEPVRGKSR